MSRQDRQGVRTPADVERKYNLGKVASSQGLSEKQKMQLDQLNQTLTQFMASTNAKFEQLGNNPGGGASVQSDHAQNDPTQPDYIKNRLAWTEPPHFSAKRNPRSSFEEISWGGDTTGRPWVRVTQGAEYCKVSDTVLTRDDLINSSCKIVSVQNADVSEGVFSISEEMLDEVTQYNDGELFISEFLVSSSKTGDITLEIYEEEYSFNIPETGTYALYNEGESEGDTFRVYVDNLVGNVNISPDSMDVVVLESESISVYLNKISDAIPDVDKLLGMTVVASLFDLSSGSWLGNESITLGTDTTDIITQYEDGSYALFEDEIPLVVCVATPGFSMNGITFGSAGTYLYCAYNGTEKFAAYCYELSSPEIVHKIDPKYIDIADFEIPDGNITVDSTVNSSSDNAVSGRAVYSHVQPIIENVNLLLNRTSSVENKYTGIDERVKTLEENPVQLPCSEYEAVPTQVIDFSVHYGWYAGSYYNTNCIARQISTESFVPEQIEGVLYKASVNDSSSSVLTVDKVYEKGSFITNDCAFIYSSGEEEIYFEYYGYLHCFAEYRTFPFVYAKLPKGLYVTEFYVSDYGCYYPNVHSIDSPIYGYNKLDHLYLNLEKEIGDDSMNPPTTTAVKKAISDASSTLNESINSLSNDTYRKAEIDSKLSRVYKYKGTVDNYSELPAEGNVDGDVWNIRNADRDNSINAGDNVVWNENDGAWDVLAGTVDLSDYATNQNVEAVAEAMQNSINSVAQQSQDGINSVAQQSQESIKAVAKEVESLSESKLDASKVGAAEGTASLDENGLVPKEQIPPEMRDIVTYGYYREALELFYEDEHFVTPIAGELGKFYLGKGDKPILYVFNGSKFVPLSGVGDSSEDDYLTDEEYEEIMGGLGI